MFCNSKFLQHFIWKGCNNQNQTISGELEALNKRFARAFLQEQSISVLSLRRQYQFFKGAAHLYQNRVKFQQVTLLIRQFGMLLNSGVPLSSALRILSQYIQNEKLKQMIESLKDATQSGYPLSQALESYSDLISPIHCQLIRVGEQLGHLDSLLESIADQRDNYEQLKHRIQTILIYPTLVIILALGVTFLLLRWVIPSFSNLFDQFHAQLPLLTRIVIALSSYFKNYGLGGAVLLVLTIFSFFILKRFNERFKKMIDRFILKLPFIRRPFQSLFLARWSSHLSLSLASGLPLLNALKMSLHLTSNSLFQTSILLITELIEKGNSFSSSLTMMQWFPKLFIQMIATGEESGQLEKLLFKISKIYEKELKHYTENTIKLLEPLTISILGVIIGTLVIAMYLPIFKLGSLF